MKIFFAALTTLLVASSAYSHDLTVVSWGGAFQAAQTKALFRPFLASTVPATLNDIAWDGGVHILQEMAQGKNSEWDVVMVNAEDLIRGCESGLFEPLDWATLGGREKYLKEAVNDCGVGAVSYSLVLGYDQDKIKNAPQSWSDFWDTQKYPGKRALRRGPKATLEFALMADGVQPADVYRLLSSAEGVDRAFKKLDQLKPHLLWWENASQAAQMLGTGEVAMAAAYNIRLVVANRVDKKRFKWTWNNSLYTMDSWVIVKASTHKAAAKQFLAYVSSAEAQARMSHEIPYGVTRKAALDLTAKDDLPSSQESRKDALLIDEKFWMQNQEKLNQRFLAWVTK